MKQTLPEVFTRLQSKVIDGLESSWSNTYAKKLYEVQPYITESNHGFCGYFVLTSAEFWLGPSDEIRTEIKKPG